MDRWVRVNGDGVRVNGMDFRGDDVRLLLVFVTMMV